MPPCICCRVVRSALAGLLLLLFAVPKTQAASYMIKALDFIGSNNDRYAILGLIPQSLGEQLLPVFPGWDDPPREKHEVSQHRKAQAAFAETVANKWNLFIFDVFRRSYPDIDPAFFNRMQQKNHLTDGQSITISIVKIVDTNADWSADRPKLGEVVATTRFAFPGLDTGQTPGEEFFESGAGAQSVELKNVAKKPGEPIDAFAWSLAYAYRMLGEALKLTKLPEKIQLFCDRRMVDVYRRLGFKLSTFGSFGSDVAMERPIDPTEVFVFGRGPVSARPQFAAEFNRRFWRSVDELNMDIAPRGKDLVIAQKLTQAQSVEDFQSLWSTSCETLGAINRSRPKTSR